MTLVEEINASQAATLEKLNVGDAKLDEIKAYILGLIEGGNGATQEQLQAILDKQNEINLKADAVVAEADALDNPQA